MLPLRQMRPLGRCLRRAAGAGPSISSLQSPSSALSVKHSWASSSVASSSVASRFVSVAAGQDVSGSASAGAAPVAAPPGLGLGGADMTMLPPLVATHPIKRMIDIAPPGVNTTLHKQMNLQFSGEAAKGSSAGDAAPADSGDASSNSSSELMMMSGEVSQLLNKKAGDKRYGSRTRLPGDFPAINEGADPALTEERPSMDQRLFAVVSVGGTQYKLTPGDILTAEHIPGAEVGTILELEDVLAVGSQAKTVLGRPAVPGVIVRVAVEEQCQDAKVIVFKKRRRKRYQKTQGHRRLVTRLRVLGIDVEGGKGLDIF